MKGTVSASMGQPNAAALPPSSLDPSPPGGEEVARPQGTSVFGTLVGLWLVFLTGTFILSLIALSMRTDASSALPHASSYPSTANDEPTVSPPRPSRPAPRLGQALVTIPATQKVGNVRAAPGMGAALVTGLPHGTRVDLEDSTRVQGKKGPETWYRIRASEDGDVEGWMHGDILRYAH